MRKDRRKRDIGGGMGGRQGVCLGRAKLLAIYCCAMKSCGPADTFFFVRLQIFPKILIMG